MEKLWIVVIVIIFILFLIKILQKKSSENVVQVEDTETKDEKEDLRGIYEKIKFLSDNELPTYLFLNEICKNNNLFLMTKVKLSDLVGVKKGNSKYKSYFNKINQKHVDFLVCDENLIPRCVIELDDSSHDKPKNKYADDVKDEILQDCGYPVLRTRNQRDEQIKNKILEIFKK